jgi:mannose-1-phosphate guanylyltransferase
MDTWAVILAGGEGQRLESLTTDASGTRIPKQFCSLHGGMSLLEETLARVKGLCARERICVSVTEQHRRWWSGPLRGMAAENLVIQPRGRGTATGILLPVLRILARDPAATVLVLPSDHYVRDEEALRRAMRHAIAAAVSRPEQIFLLGVEPDEPDPELGYVLADPQPRDTVRIVRQFVEKPRHREDINQLIVEGAMWNSFIFSASGSGLLKLYEANAASTLRAMRTALEQDRLNSSRAAMRRLYESLPNADFCKDVLAGQERRLGLVPVAACGWSDLGTPLRLLRAVRRLGVRRWSTATSGSMSRTLNLSDQVDRVLHGASVNME